MRFRSDNGPNLTMAFTAPLWTNGASLSATLRQITAKVTTTMRKRPSRLSNSWLRKSPHPETGHGGVQAGTPGIPKFPPPPREWSFAHANGVWTPASLICPSAGASHAAEESSDYGTSARTDNTSTAPHADPSALDRDAS
jgi:hypothetical protein